MLYRPLAIILFVLFIVVGFQNCAETQSNNSAQLRAVALQYFQTVGKVRIDVFFEPGAEPFVGNTNAGTPYWGILEENLVAIFQYRSAPPSLTVPKELAQMTAMPEQSKTSWTADDIISLSKAHPAPSLSNGEVNFRIYFLNGYFSRDGNQQTGVIGVSLTGTNIIAMFKDVIESTGANPNGPIPKFVEQSTLVHEMGHALGFVNNGVPMASPHQDAEHGAHTQNQDCVMYWLNEGKNDLVQFVQKYLTSSSRVMWGPEVLADAKAISR